jgi:hypothetical protein
VQSDDGVAGAQSLLVAFAPPAHATPQYHVGNDASPFGWPATVPGWLDDGADDLVPERDRGLLASKRVGFLHGNVYRAAFVLFEVGAADAAPLDLDEGLVRLWDWNRHLLHPHIALPVPACGAHRTFGSTHCCNPRRVAVPLPPCLSPLYASVPG